MIDSRYVVVDFSRCIVCASRFVGLTNGGVYTILYYVSETVSIKCFYISSSKLVWINFAFSFNIMFVSVLLWYVRAPFMTRIVGWKNFLIIFLRSTAWYVICVFVVVIYITIGSIFVCLLLEEIVTTVNKSTIELNQRWYKNIVSNLMSDDWD